MATGARMGAKTSVAEMLSISAPSTMRMRLVNSMNCQVGIFAASTHARIRSGASISARKSLRPKASTTMRMRLPMRVAASTRMAGSFASDTSPCTNTEMTTAAANATAPASVGVNTPP